MYFNIIIEFLNTGYIPESLIYKKDELFKESYFLGSLDAAKYLWEKTNHKIDIHANDEGAFIWSCSFNLNFAKWLWVISKHNINIHISNDYIFRTRHYNDLNSAKWLQVISNYKLNVCAKYFKKYNIPFIIKYKYQTTYLNDNLHIIHFYYKPTDGPGYLNAINF